MVVEVEAVVMVEKVVEHRLSKKLNYLEQLLPLMIKVGDVTFWGVSEMVAFIPCLRMNSRRKSRVSFCRGSFSEYTSPISIMVLLVYTSLGNSVWQSIITVNI